MGGKPRTHEGPCWLMRCGTCKKLIEQCFHKNVEKEVQEIACIECTLADKSDEKDVRIAELQAALEEANGNLRELTAVRDGEMSWRDGKFNLNIKHWVVKMMGEAFYDYLIEHGGENYVEARMTAERDGEVSEIVVTVGYGHKKTPHQCRKEAEAERDRLQRALWVLGHEPWTTEAPGLRAYVRDLVVSGQPELGPDKAYELRYHLAAAIHHVNCRKLMYDLGSSPCTCDLEKQRDREEARREQESPTPASPDEA